MGKFNLCDKVGEEIVVDHTLLQEKQVVSISNMKQCKIKLSHVGRHLIKLFVDRCTECLFDFEVEFITQHVEISHCSDCTINNKVPLLTLQLDLCKDMIVKYQPKCFM